MPDPRFFESLPATDVAGLADRIGAEVLRGGDRKVSAVAPLGTAVSTDVAFMSGSKFADALRTTGAGCVIIPAAAVELAPDGASVLVSRTPQAAWAAASLLFHAPRALDTAADRASVIEDDSVVLEPGVVIGVGARIGWGTRIGANTVHGPGDR